MFRVTLTMMRRHARQLVLAGIAILVGTAFISMTFLFGNSIGRILTDVATFQYGKANYVAMLGTGDKIGVLTLPQVEKIAAIKGVRGVRGDAQWETALTGPNGKSAAGSTIPAPIGDSTLSPLRCTKGRLPADSEIAISASQQRRLGAHPGDTLTVTVYADQGSSNVNVSSAKRKLRVSGILADPLGGSLSMAAGISMMTSHDLVSALVGSVNASQPTGDSGSTARGSKPEKSASHAPADPDILGVSNVYLLVGSSRAGYPQVAPDKSTDGSLSSVPAGTGSPSDTAVLKKVRAALPEGWSIYARGVQAAQTVSGFANDQDIIEIFLLSFGILALLVAALVIVNTFQVLVAQRRRSLALLRAVGASKSQLYGSVVEEAGILGLVSSLAGIVAAYLAVFLLADSGILSRMVKGYGGPAIRLTLVPDWRSVVLPLVFGLLVTVLSSLSAARTATNVTPLEALQPMPQMPTKKGGIVRAVFTFVFLVAGIVFALLSARAITSPRLKSEDYTGWLALGVLACALLFLAFAISAIWWMPWLMRGSASIVSHFGPASHIAAANVRRNPHRIATTGLALFIGVTLVATVATGAASVQATAEDQLDTHYSVDIVVYADHLDRSALSGIKNVKGVQSAVRVTTVGVLLNPSGSIAYRGLNDPTAFNATVYLLSTADRHKVMRTQDVSSARGEALLSTQELVHSSADSLADNRKERNKAVSRLSHADSVVLTFPQEPVDKSEATPQQLREAKKARRANGYEDEDDDSAQEDDSDDDDEIDVMPLYTTLKVRHANFTAPEEGGLSILASPGAIPETFLAHSQDVSQEIWVRLKPGAKPAAVMSGLQDALSGYMGVSLSGPVAERVMLNQAISIIMALLITLLGVSILIALIGVANTLSLSVIERTRESATLRAIGMTRGQLRGSLAVEALVISLTSTIAGLAVGTFFGWFGSLLVLQATVSDLVFRFDWEVALAILALAIVAAILSSLAPARRALKTSPIAALADD